MQDGADAEATRGWRRLVAGFGAWREVAADLCGSRRDIHLLLLLCLWYASSAVTSLSTKEILRSFPFPITVALVQQSVSTVLGWAGSSAASAQVFSSGSGEWVVVPVSTCMVGSIVAYRCSLLSVSVAFTHTIKSLGPLWTLAFSRLLLDEPCCTPSQLGVLPVVLGVAITTVTEAEFAWAGFVAAVGSTAAQALQMVLAKQMLTKHGVAKADLFYQVGACSILLLLPLFAVVDLWRLHATGLAALLRTAHWLLLNALCTFVNQYAGLSVLDAMVSPLSHALANVMKRAAVITIAMLYARRPVTPLHLFGCLLSVFGSFIYQQAASWFGERQRREASYELLPLTDSPFIGHADAAITTSARRDSKRGIKASPLPQPRFEENGRSDRDRFSLRRFLLMRNPSPRDPEDAPALLEHRSQQQISPKEPPL